MRHAGPAALASLEGLLASLRGIPGLAERSRGVFTLRGRAFLHFHEDPAGLFVDLRAAGGEFERIALTGDHTELVAIVAARTAELGGKTG
jgi:hypothetical protein